jgi:hypothetical protein
VRAAVLREVGGFDERLRVAEDRDLWTRIALLENSFTLLQRRTVIRRYSDRSLMVSGRRHGYYLSAFERRADRALGELEARGERAGLIAQARGARSFVSAWCALDRDDFRGVQAHLEEACRLLPELSREPELVENVLCFLPRAHEPQQRLHQLATVARLWPDSRADTALYLRLLAILVALRRARVREAGALLRRWPLRATSAFARRVRGPLARRVRLELDARLHREVDQAERGCSRGVG